jgi:hypothetical protein
MEASDDEIIPVRSVCKLGERVARFNTTEKGLINRLIFLSFGTIFSQNPDPSDWRQVKEDRSAIEKLSLDAFFSLLAKRAFQWAERTNLPFQLHFLMWFALLLMAAQ